MVIAGKAVFGVAAASDCGNPSVAWSKPALSCVLLE
jgi:hypothetical protein